LSEENQTSRKGHYIGKVRRAGFKLKIRSRGRPKKGKKRNVANDVRSLLIESEKRAHARTRDRQLRTPLSVRVPGKA